ncbi:VAMP-like protein YKT61 isoform X3 [Brassica rapa]|uniref:VAMP-like protein YKT61 isoform X3 n=1 Tax=Brassica campestris TaxID=3711 RepID=UPI0006AB486F|nr:VAMP-like protein YKT61 isoform X3 [Brassica rapa]
MSITALLVLKCTPDTPNPVILAHAFDFSGFNYFYHPNISEFVRFFGSTVAGRTLPSQRQSVKHKGSCSYYLPLAISALLFEFYEVVHAYNRNGLCAVGFMDDCYPVRSAFSLLDQVLDEYQKIFGETWRSTKEVSNQKWPYLVEALEKFKDPAEADKLLKIQIELDETSIIIHKTIDGLLARGEKLDNLVEKSSDLNKASKMFYKRARKTNSCCTIL